MVVGRVSDADVGAAGGLNNLITELLERLRNGTMEAREKSASTLACLAEQQKDKADTIGKCGGVPPLIALVLVGSPLAQEYAAAALAFIAEANKEHKQAIIDQGAITPLATILRSGGGRAQEQAAAAFASISDHPLAQKTIIKVGCVSTLVHLLGRSTVAQVNASRALANVAGLNLDGQAEIHKAGAVKHLLHLLGSGKAQEHAARAIATLSCRNATIQADVCNQGGVPRLLALLSDRNVEARIQAAAALAELAHGANGSGHRKTQDAISKAGGIAPLLAMVECNPVVLRAIAESVRCLAEVARRNRANQDLIASMSGMKTLVNLLSCDQSGAEARTSSSNVQANAAFGLAEICRGNKENQSTVAELGGIGQLVNLVKSSSSMDVLAELAGALWTVSFDHPSNKISIASGGAVPDLVKLLGSNSERAQKNAANALASLALANTDNQALAAPLLVKMLGHPSDATQKRAAKALWRIVKENPEHQEHIAKAGGAEMLVQLLSEGSPGAKKYSLWSLSQCIDTDNQATVSESGGGKPLVVALTMDNQTVALQAAAALAKLALANTSAQKEIASSGGVEPLVSLLDRFESESTQENAAATLSELALLPSNHASIDRAGGIAPLVALLLHDGALSAKHYAASALARISEGKQNEQQIEGGKGFLTRGVRRMMSKAEQIAEAGAITPLVNLLSGLRGDDAQEAAANALRALAGDSSNRLLITESGGIGPLVLLLGCANVKAREHAEAALVRLSIEKRNRTAIIKQLVSMLHDSGTEAREQAAAALAKLARDSTDNRVSIVEAGGIKPLLKLLRGGSLRAKEKSASALTHLCETGANQDAIAEAGGVSLLVGVLQSSSSNKEASAVALSSLTACAIWKLCEDNQPNQLEVAEAGAIIPLVSMLGSPSPEMQANAAGALSTLAHNNQDNQSAIARTGAIAPLCTLVREGNDETKEQSASALWALSKDNAPNQVCANATAACQTRNVFCNTCSRPPVECCFGQATIAKLGGVEPLVGLLVSGISQSAQDYAAGALASLASKHSENRQAIAKRLVGLLNSRVVERATRCLSALTSLSNDHSVNQLAIAKAGGIPLLIGWLSHPSEEVQREAAHAVLAISASNVTTQVSQRNSNILDDSEVPRALSACYAGAHL